MQRLDLDSQSRRLAHYVITVADPDQGWTPGAMALKVSARENLVSAKQAPGRARSLLSLVSNTRAHTLIQI